MSGTGLLCSAIGLRTRSAFPDTDTAGGAICLRKCYAMPGTARAYAPRFAMQSSVCDAMRGTARQLAAYACATQSAVQPYHIPGTQHAYAAKRDTKSLLSAEAFQWTLTFAIAISFRLFVMGARPYATRLPPTRYLIPDIA
eukprot:3671610-Rhodomonas_salina.2